MLEYLRKQGFWLLDGLRGGVVKAHYRDIDYLLRHHAQTLAAEKRQGYLYAILQHAVQTVPFYKDYDAREGLHAFPIINKSIIKNQFENFKSSEFLHKPVVEVVTSGSTGTPFKVLHDPNKKLRNTADTLFFAKAAGFEIGTQLVYFKIWNEINRKSTVKAWMENVTPIDVTNLSHQHLQEIVDRLAADRSTKGLLGYASAIEKLAAFLRENNIDGANLNVTSIITMSEGLDKRAKALMESRFGCRVAARYSNVENGIIAQQCLGGNGEFHVNTASYHVEILKMETDVPASPGEVGRIVVTDYFNRAMPLIRYDTGDIGAYEERAACSFATPVLTKVEGRKMDMIFNTRGELVSSFIVTNSMWNYPELKQYQFIQQGARTYLFKLNIDGNFGRENELVEEFKSYLGQDAEIAVEYVSEIPLLDSGKRKKVVNTMH